MSWYNPRSWYKGREEKTLALGTSEELGSFLLLGTGTAATPAAALALYEQSTAVSIPVNMIADPFSIMEPQLEIDGKIIRQHPILDRLNNPSPYFTRELFFEMLCKEYLVTGETTFVSLGGVNRPPLELQPISVKHITITPGQNGYPFSIQTSGNTLPFTYFPKIKNGHVRYFDGGLREITQIRNYSTKDNSLLRGQSLLLAASKEVRQHILGGKHNISILEKGGRISLIFHFDADMDDEDFEIAKERVRAQYGGAGNAGEIGVTAGGELKIQQVGASNKEMDFGGLHKMASKAVGLQYHIPLPLITDERQTLNNYREGKLAIYDDAIMPVAIRIFRGISGSLFPRYNLDPNRTVLTFNPDKISALVSRRNDEVKKRHGIGVESDNETRAYLGREPYDGGDVILKPVSMMPVGTDTSIDDNEIDFVEDDDDV